MNQTCHAPEAHRESQVCDRINKANACEVAGQYPEAYALLQSCELLLQADAQHSRLLPAVKAGLWRLAPLWWATLQHGGISLRRCQADDSEFFRRCYGDAQFNRQFARRQPWSGDLASALKKSGALPPIQTGLLMWVLQSSTQGRIGLASLSSIDATHRRAELSIGLPGEIPSTLGIKATLMMLHFALVMMPFNKVYAYVYEDNPQALHNALRLGFVHEGRLQDHFHVAGQGFVSVDVLGLTRRQLHDNPALKALAKRRIGQVW